MPPDNFDLYPDHLIAFLNICPAIKDDLGVYPVSERLLMAALLQNQTYYIHRLTDFQTALTTIFAQESLRKYDEINVPASAKTEEGKIVPGFLAWMNGRLLSAANSMQDLTQAQQARETLHIELKNAPDNVFTSWAWGYAAGDTGINEPTYRIYLEKAKSCAKQDLWAWVMIIQATANHKDAQGFTAAMQSLSDIVKPDTPEQFAQKLFDTFPVKDYRAWAFGIITSAASILDENNVYENFRPHLDKAIDQAEPLSADCVLASASRYTAVKTKREKAKGRLRMF